MTELNIYEPTRQLRSSSDTSMLLLFKYFIIIIALNDVGVGAFFQHKLINLSHRRYRRYYNSSVDSDATVQPEMSRAPVQKLKKSLTVAPPQSPPKWILCPRLMLANATFCDIVDCFHTNSGSYC